MRDPVRLCGIRAAKIIVLQAVLPERIFQRAENGGKRLFAVRAEAESALEFFVRFCRRAEQSKYPVFQRRSLQIAVVAVAQRVFRGVEAARIGVRHDEFVAAHAQPVHADRIFLLSVAYVLY